jgi:hypothetical protein
VIPHEEWEVLYRERLQVEREIAGRGSRPVTADGVRREDRGGILGTLLRAVRALVP